MTVRVDAHTPSGSHEQSGHALPVVIVVLGIIAAVSARFVGEARLELDMQRAMHARAMLESLARDVALGFDPAWLDGARGGSVSYACPTGDDDLSLTLWRQDRLTDLNSAPAGDIAEALGKIGLPARSVGQVAADIVRYRSYDPHVRFEAAQDGIAGGLKRGPFEAVEELADFDALAPVEPSRLRRVFTVRPRSGTTEDDIAGTYAVDARAKRRDGRAAASFGAVLSLDQGAQAARLVDVFDPGVADSSAVSGALPCPALLKRFLARRAEDAERLR